MAAALKTASGRAHLRMAEKRLPQRLACPMQSHAHVAFAQPQILGDGCVRVPEEIGAPEKVREVWSERGQMRSHALAFEDLLLIGNLRRHCGEFHQHAIARGSPPITVDQGAPEDALKPGAHARAVSQLIAGLECSHAKVLESVFSVLGCSEATAKIAEERHPVLDESGSNCGFKRATALANGYTRRSGLPGATGPDMRTWRGRRMWRHSPPRRLTTDSIRMAGDVACCRWRFGARLADASQRGGGGGIDRRRRLKPTTDGGPDRPGSCPKDESGTLNERERVDGATGAPGPACRPRYRSGLWWSEQVVSQHPADTRTGYRPGAGGPEERARAPSLDCRDSHMTHDGAAACEVWAVTRTPILLTDFEGGGCC